MTATGGSAPRRRDGLIEWFRIFRLGLVQTALGAIVVLTTATLNRVMQLELGFVALLPAALVAFHYAVQISRPRWGWRSDQGGRRTPWILAGMAVLAAGGALAALATALMATRPTEGIALAVLAFLLIGVGVGAAGTTLLALLSTTVRPERRPAAASVVWIMMIAGFALTAGLAGAALEPFSLTRLVEVTAVVSAGAFALSALALWGVERAAARDAAAAAPAPAPEGAPAPARAGSFWDALRDVWADDDARRFTYFVFIAMLAYNAQDVVLEPFSGYVFGLSVGASTQLSGVHHGGVLIGLLAVAFLGRRFGSLRAWTALGCLASALAFIALAAAAQIGPGFPLHAVVAALGVSNGAFAGAAIASMMALAGAAGRDGAGRRREGVRLGVWGAAQALGFGLAGLIGAATKDATLALDGSEAAAYSAVFALEAGLFVAAALLAASVGGAARGAMPKTAPVTGDFDAARADA